jgi:hypothetical protein
MLSFLSVSVLRDLLLNIRNFIRCTIAKSVRLIGDGIHLQLIPAPSTGNGWPAAGAVQSPFLREADNLRYQVGSVSVRTEANQIPGAALRTLEAVTNATRHSTIDRAETSRFSAIQAALKSGCTNIPVALERFLETVDRSVVCTSDTLTVGGHKQFVRGQMMNVYKMQTVR